LCNSLDLPIPILLAYPTTLTLTFPDIDTDDQDEDINIHSAEGLKWEFKLVTSKLIEKKSFIENQVSFSLTLSPFFLSIESQY